MEESIILLGTKHSSILALKRRSHFTLPSRTPRDSHGIPIEDPSRENSPNDLVSRTMKIRGVDVATDFRTVSRDRRRPRAGLKSTNEPRYISARETPACWRTERIHYLSVRCRGRVCRPSQPFVSRRQSRSAALEGCWGRCRAPTNSHEVSSGALALPRLPLDSHRLFDSRRLHGGLLRRSPVRREFWSGGSLSFSLLFP